MEIFVSYAREDAARVQPLAQGLEKHGWTVFWDRKIPTGKSWHEVLEEALSRADRVIVVWSRYSVKSGFVRDEAARAQAREVLVPVLIDDVPPPLGFGHIQAANLVEWSGNADAEAFQSLLADLGAPASHPAPQGSSLPAAVSAIAANVNKPPRSLLVPASAGALLLALGAVGYCSTAPKRTQPRAGGAATNAPSGVAKPAASQQLAPQPTPQHSAQAPDGQSPRQAALARLHAYYDAINQRDFEAQRFFVPRPSHFYLWTAKPSDPITLGKIDTWMKGHALRSKMDDGSLEQSASGAFSYIETQYVRQKDGKEKPYTALLAVELNAQLKITRLQTVAKRPP